MTSFTVVKWKDITKESSPKRANLSQSTMKKAFYMLTKLATCKDTKLLGAESLMAE